MQSSSPEEIIAQLEAIAALFKPAALAVYSADGDRIIFLQAGEADNTKQLTDLMKTGAWPMAFVCVKRESHKLDVMVNPLPLPLTENLPDLDIHVGVVVEHFTRLAVEAGKLKTPVNA